MDLRHESGEIMPDVLTHILFAESVKDLIEDSNIRQFMDENEKLYNLGAQGPDILFYYKPWNPFGGSIRVTGHKMHVTETAKFFKDAVILLNTLTGSEYEALLVYLLGFLSHYYCDKSAHPYVNSMIESGCYTQDGDRKKLSHYEIEATIDTRLWNEEKRITASLTNVTELIKTDELPEVITEYISKYIYETQTFVISNTEIKRAVLNMQKILNILFDPNDKKKKIINKFPLPRKCYVNDEFSNVDVLNMKRRPWHVPGKEDISLNSSVGDILSGAIKDCAQVTNAIIGFLENGTELELDKVIPNVSYSTGEPI